MTSRSETSKRADVTTAHSGGCPSRDVARHVSTRFDTAMGTQISVADLAKVPVDKCPRGIPVRVKAQLWFHVDGIQRPCRREPVLVLRRVLLSGPITALALIDGYNFSEAPQECKGSVIPLVLRRRGTTHFALSVDKVPDTTLWSILN